MCIGIASIRNTYGICKITRLLPGEVKGIVNCDVVNRDAILIAILIFIKLIAFMSGNISVDRENTELCN